jgi:hypothetical protein
MSLLPKAHCNSHIHQVLGGAGMLTEWGQGCQFNHNNTGECGPVMDLADSRLTSWIDWYWQEQLSPGKSPIFVSSLLLGVAALERLRCSPVGLQRVSPLLHSGPRSYMCTRGHLSASCSLPIPYLFSQCGRPPLRPSVHTLARTPELSPARPRRCISTPPRRASSCAMRWTPLSPRLRRST